MREHRVAACILQEPVFSIVAIGIDWDTGIAESGECEQRVDPSRIGKVKRASSLLEIGIQSHRLVSTDFLTGVKSTDQPINMIVNCRTLQAQFLRKGLDMVTRRQDADARCWCAITDRIGVIGGEATDRCRTRIKLTICSNRGQLCATQVPFQFGRSAPLLRAVLVRTAVDRQILKSAQSGLVDAIAS